MQPVAIGNSIVLHTENAHAGAIKYEVQDSATTLATFEMSLGSESRPLRGVMSEIFSR